MIINKRYMLDAIEQFSAGQKDDIAFMKLLSEFDSFCFQELRRYKSAHADMVTRCALLRQRPDMPVDRIPAYQELVRLQNMVAARLRTDEDDTPVAVDPITMLEFLAGRMEFAGISDGVAELYAQDIRLILNGLPK